MGTGTTDITATTATLNGGLTSTGGAAITVTIYLGTANGGTTTASRVNNIPLGIKATGAFSAGITGLTASTTYYYRCSATNATGMAWAGSTANSTTIVSQSGEITGGHTDYIPVTLNAGGSIQGTFAAHYSWETLRISIQDPSNAEVRNYGVLLNGNINYTATTGGVYHIVIANFDTFMVGTLGYTINYSIVN